MGADNGNHLCWTGGTNAGTATCGSAGSATDIGTTGCGAANDVDLAWTTTSNTHIAIAECDTGGNAVGTEVDIVLNLNIAVTGGNAQYLAAGATVAVANADNGNHLCWTAGTNAGTASCNSAGTATDIGTTGCGAANDFDLAWTTTSSTHIAIAECNTGGNAVGTEVDIVLNLNIAVTGGNTQTLVAGATVAV